MILDVGTLVSTVLVFASAYCAERDGHDAVAGAVLVGGLAGLALVRLIA